jgi:hypothetical protein
MEILLETRKEVFKILQIVCVSIIFRLIKLRRMGWAGHVKRMGERRGVHNFFMGKPGGNRLLGKPRRRWEDNLYLLSLMIKVPDHVYVLGYTYTCHTLK